MSHLYVGNDYTATLSSLTGGGTPLTSATVTVQLYTLSGTPVGSAVTLAHTGGGNYTGTLESSAFASVSVGTRLTVRYVASQGGYDAEWRETRMVMYRPPTV